MCQRSAVSRQSSAIAAAAFRPGSLQHSGRSAGRVDLARGGGDVTSSCHDRTAGGGGGGVRPLPLLPAGPAAFGCLAGPDGDADFGI